MKNDLVFDNSKKQEMQEFLNFIYTITIQNPSENINSSAIYDILRFRYIPDNEKDSYGRGKTHKQFFDRWRKRFRNRKNIDAFYNEYASKFFQFSNMDFLSDEFIKLYIPLNAPHLYEGVNRIFDFLDDENIRHESKVGCQSRSDVVIIRLEKGDINSLYKIINFIRDDKYIRTGLNKNNPFIPTIDGIGCMRDYGNSYNSNISDLIYIYIKECINHNVRPNIDEFKEYIKKMSNDDSLIETFENAYYGNKAIIGEKYPLTDTQKYNLFVDTLKSTYSKYGFTQVSTALKTAIFYNNYKFFTNGLEGFRNKMKENISRDEMIIIINNLLFSIYGSKYQNIDMNNKIDYLIYYMFQDNNKVYKRA